jgi:signal transduction histidine kinase
MVEFVAKFFSSTGFGPHVLLDLFIALAYYSIPFALLYFVSRRQDLICKRVFIMFGALMCFCGTIHLFNIWMIWHGTSHFEGLVKFATAASAVTTAALLWCVIPAILRLPHPAQLVQANQALQAELTARQHTAEALRQAEHLARLGRLAASVSHDLRNPLASVALHVELIEETLLTPTPENLAEVAASLATIKVEMARVHGLVQDYLTLVRPTTLPRQTLDFWACVDNFVREVQPQVEQHGITLYWERPTIAAPVALHPNAFHRVLFNLVQNALDAMPQGGSLTLLTRRMAFQIQLDMRDTGTGIPADQLTRIFEPLYTTKPTGTGLGLYLVQEIVAAHGGGVVVQSEGGHGATFTISLPLVTATEPFDEQRR